LQREKKIRLIFIWIKKVTDNKYNLYQIYEFKIIVYDMKLKWINWHHAYDHMCDDKKKIFIW